MVALPETLSRRGDCQQILAGHPRVISCRRVYRPRRHRLTARSSNSRDTATAYPLTSRASQRQASQMRQQIRLPTPLWHSRAGFRRSPRSTRAAFESAVEQGTGSGFSVRLIDALNAGEAVRALSLPFFSSRTIALGLFKELKDQLQRNAREMSGVPHTDVNTAKLVRPTDHRGSPAEGRCRIPRAHAAPWALWRDHPARTS